MWMRTTAIVMLLGVCELMQPPFPAPEDEEREHTRAYTQGGFPGQPGFPGLPGPKGEPGVCGCTSDIIRHPSSSDMRGDMGLPGEPGLPGRPGFPGAPGLPGMKGSTGDVGRPGLPGLPGYSSSKGEPGLPGAPGYPGLPGSKGDPGSCGCSERNAGYYSESGNPGVPGLPGLKGDKGDTGMPGVPGRPGLAGPPGLPGLSGRRKREIEETRATKKGGAVTGYLVHHSQSADLPRCPLSSTQLWTGYSFAASDNRNRPGHIDLGATASCLPHFTPNLHCYAPDECAQSESSQISTHWLATLDSDSKISRCVVCHVSQPVAAVHSQTVDVPECPNGWRELWDGFTFMPTSTGYELASPGSCLEKYKKRPIVQCSDDMDSCAPDGSRSFWLAAAVPENNLVRSNTALNHSPSISRCQVCMKDPSAKQ